MSQVDLGRRAVQPGTLMQKPIPPRMVEPYLAGRRSVISGFVYQVADVSASTLPELHRLFGLDYDGSEFSMQPDEMYLLRWRAVGVQAYQVPCSAEHGGDWVLKPPFDGTGYVTAGDRRVPEYFADLMPVPVGAEMHRIGADATDFIARYDGQVWLRPAEGSELCVTG